MVEFLDHSIYGKRSKSIHIVAGRVDSVDENHIHFNWWYCLDKDADDSSHEWGSILKSCVVRWAYCRPAKWYKKVD